MWVRPGRVPKELCVNAYRASPFLHSHYLPSLTIPAPHHFLLAFSHFFFIPNILPTQQLPFKWHISRHAASDAWQMAQSVQADGRQLGGHDAGSVDWLTLTIAP
jgi:hypothetical protein